ncbi:MAG TPA: FAD-linked oxidase C-terminal domain-containing protein [Gaiellaceae bacterium]|nr:FAD-linked oxidase C-terminal domain-containing protein [Gaiellaceae bacterium]
MERELRAIVGEEAVLTEIGWYASDLTGLPATADAVVLPGTAEEVAGVVAWCYEHDVPITPRGGGTGAAGGCVPIDGGIILALDRLDRVRQFDPLLWRMHIEAGVKTGHIHALARDNGLMFAPDPGASEQSQIGGNIATNAAGPHAYKYGATGAWVTGLEAVVPPGEVITVGGPIRKDVAGYDVKSLLIGSEGTLGVVTAAWLRLVPAPEVVLPVAAFLPDTATGCAAILRVIGSGIRATAIEFLDGETLACAGGSFDGRPLPEGAGFMVIAEADGSAAEAAAMQAELIEVLGEGAISVHAPSGRADIEALWRWRGGLAFAVLARRGLALSEDIVVPVDRLEEAIESTYEIGNRHDVVAVSFGHAGDGNLHSTFLFSPDVPEERDRAFAASHELFDLAVRLGGSISGEHGLGYLKRGQLEKQWPPRAIELHEAVKRVFDPKGLLNPGKKLARLA